MIGKPLFPLLLLVFPITHDQGNPAQDKVPRNPLAGTWSLVRYADTPRGGSTIHAFGERPVGQFIFTEDGHISVHIMHNPPDPKDAEVDPDPETCSPGWYCGYFGTYTVDIRGHYWIAHVLGGNIPAYVGTDQKRSFTIDGDQLVISETYVSDGVPVSAERVLVRDRGLLD